MNGPFDLAKVALYLMRFPNLNYDHFFRFHQLSNPVSMIRQILPPASSGVIIRCLSPLSLINRTDVD